MAEETRPQSSGQPDGSAQPGSNGSGQHGDASPLSATADFTLRAEGQVAPRVVIVGGGFGGLKVAHLLAGKGVSVTLVDKHNYHTFLPLLYQVGAAELDAESIGYPLRGILREKQGVRFLMTEVTGADLDRKVLKTHTTEIPFDFLVLAAGSVSHFFGVPGAEEYALPLKTLEEGTSLRSHILDCFERAAHEPDPNKRRRALTFTLVGGGPTGVEFAGALAELVYRPLVKDYPSLDFSEVRIVLVEAHEHILMGFPQRLQDYALTRLRSMKVDVLLRGSVQEVTEGAVTLKDGSHLETETVVWTAGVGGNPLSKAMGLPTAPNGRTVVEPSLQVPGHPRVYALGDMAQTEQAGKPLPMIAPVALQQGETVARNILRQIKGQPPEPFSYKDPGSMVTIGRNKAVAHLAGRSFTGFPAWIIWLTVHLMKLVGFRNRLMVLINWAWDYLFYERTERLILPQRRRAPAEPQSTQMKAKTTVDANP
ncbi:MAG TPA: NAD(P)/FAD-dependent oxidoreductase [Armatimonadota bacterium]